ncbi:hypothetical protein CLF_110205 [Clonorchis sinensis]|uniref:Uncharacterized protein n=1 Tax=Clonorchis sinensis TaxID=79923 RepID=G7YT99_CLOSI|nr:hypothetical protein CLF_110205 [Clonorchis sinensis]
MGAFISERINHINMANEARPDRSNYSTYEPLEQGVASDHVERLAALRKMICFDQYRGVYRSRVVIHPSRLEIKMGGEEMEKEAANSNYLAAVRDCQAINSITDEMHKETEFHAVQKLLAICSYLVTCFLSHAALFQGPIQVKRIEAASVLHGPIQEVDMDTYFTKRLSKMNSSAALQQRRQIMQTATIGNAGGAEEALFSLEEFLVNQPNNQSNRYYATKR